MPTLAIKVLPNASKTEIVGWHNGFLKIKLRAIPEKGKANTELCLFMAKVFSVRKSDVTLVSGEKNRLKQIQVDLIPNLKRNDQMAGGNFVGRKASDWKQSPVGLAPIGQRRSKQNSPCPKG